MNLSQMALVLPALWADASLPEVSWIPGSLRGPGSNPNTARSLKGDHLKLKTWIQKFVSSKSEQKRKCTCWISQLFHG